MSIPSKFEADRDNVIRALALFEKKTPAEMAELERVDPLVQARHSLVRLMATSLLNDLNEVTKREAELERIRGRAREMEERLNGLAATNADLTNKNVELTAEVERQRHLAAANTPAEMAEKHIEEVWTKGSKEMWFSVCPFAADTIEWRWWHRGRDAGESVLSRLREEARSEGARATWAEIEKDWTAGGNAADSHDRVDKWFLRGLAHKNAKAIAKRERKFDEELKKAVENRDGELLHAWNCGYNLEAKPGPYTKGTAEDLWFERGSKAVQDQKIVASHEGIMQSLASRLRTKDGAFSFAAIVDKIEELHGANNMMCRAASLLRRLARHDDRNAEECMGVVRALELCTGDSRKRTPVIPPPITQKSAILVDSEKLYDAHRTPGVVPPPTHDWRIDGGDEWESKGSVTATYEDGHLVSIEGLVQKTGSPARLEVREGYHALAKILDLALDQAQSGKGRKRHGQQAEWTAQKICQIPLMQGHVGGLVYQIVKKATECEQMDDSEAQFREALGVVVYAAALAHHYREEIRVRDEICQETE